MGFRATPKKAIAFTKASVALACSWPPSLRATAAEFFLFNILWCAAFISATGLLVPLLFAIYEYRKEPIILGKNVCLFAAVTQVTIKMIVCRVMQRKFQRLFFEMENFCKNATEEEEIILQRHVDKYKHTHGIYILWCFLTTVFVISGPLYSPQVFPTHAKYPFPVERQPLRSIIFFHQSLVGFQVSAGMAIDVQVALLLRYTAARFEILAMQLERVKCESEINACIRDHMNLLRYTRNAYQAVRFIVLTTDITTNVAVIFGSLNLITRQPLPLKVLYGLVVVSASGELFMYAWSADCLIRQSMGTAMSAFNTNWYEKYGRYRRKIYFIMQRSQKLETIRIKGILPNISLSYYAKAILTKEHRFLAQFPQCGRFALANVTEELVFQLCDHYTLIMIYFGKVTPEKVIAVIKFCVALNHAWPLSSNSTRRQMFFYNVLKFFNLIVVVTVFLSLAYSAYLRFDEPVLLSKIAMTSFASIHIACKLLDGYVNHDIQQRLIEEMINFCKNAEAKEREVLQLYVDRFSLFYGLTTMWISLSVVGMTINPIFTDQQFPLVTEFPFRADYEPVRTLLYVEQYYFICMCVATLSANNMVALLMIFAVVRFEILIRDLRAAVTVAELNNCIKQYSIVRKYAEDVVEGVKYIALVTLVIGFLNAIACGLNTIGKQPIPVKCQFLFTLQTSLVIVFMCAWPADVLMDMSENAIYAVFESKWYEQYLSVQRMVFTMLVPQKPIVISITGMIAAFNMNYYSSFILNAFSLFTTLRVVMEESEDIIKPLESRTTHAATNQSIF